MIRFMTNKKSKAKNNIFYFKIPPSVKKSGGQGIFLTGIKMFITPVSVHIALYE